MPANGGAAKQKDFFMVQHCSKIPSTTAMSAASAQCFFSVAKVHRV